jgi:hypothetical protein
LIDADFLDVKRLSKDWKDITGDSYIVDLRAVTSVKDGLRYLLKYVSKPPQLWGENEGLSAMEKEERREDFNSAMKGVRTVQPFGKLYGELTLDLPDVACPQCGAHEWVTWEFDLGPEFRKFKDGKG